MKSIRHFKNRSKRCFELAALPFIRDDPVVEGATLVHGTLAHAEGFRYPHAWIELADKRIYDAVHDRYFSASEYESKFHPVVERTYTGRQQVCRMLAENHHYGPWHEPEPAVLEERRREWERRYPGIFDELARRKAPLKTATRKR